MFVDLKILFSLLEINLPVTYFIIIVGLLVLFAIFILLLYRFFRNKYSGTQLHSALQEKNLMRQLIDNAPDRIYYKDRNSRFILANKFVAKIMKVKSPEELIGKTDFDFYPKEIAQQYYDDEQTFMKLGKPLINKEEVGYNPDGKEIVVSTTKIPIKDRQNNVIGIIGIGRDISDQKEAEALLKEKTENLKETNVLLEERQEEIQQMAEELNSQAEYLKKVNTELERLSLVASRTENVVIITDGSGNFEWVNEGFRMKYGMTMEDYVEKNERNLRQNSANDNIAAILNQVYISRKPFTYNSKYIDKNGQVNWSQSNLTPIVNENNEIEHLILIDSDITDLKNADIKISKQNQEIKKQSEELQALNATKDRLLSIIAHDLKNPFHSILGFTEILQKKYQTIEREKLKQYLGMMQKSTTSAYELLENLLEWARTQTSNVRYNPEMKQLKSLVNDTISLLKLHADNKKIELINQIDDDLHAFIDKNMFQTVIRNITSNAIKFSNEGGSVRLSSEKEDNIVKIHIEDSGVGIPEEKIKNLFKLENISSNTGTSGETGTGLGLIVCADFMKISGGSIDVQSLPGKGSTFTLSLPAKEIKSNE